MFERDYIKRLIQQFAEVVAKIILYKNNKDWQQVQMVIDVSGKQLLGLNPDLTENMSAEELIRVFSIKEEIDYEKCLIMAVLQYEQAIVYAHTNAPESNIFKAYLKSFILFRTAFKNIEFKSKKDLGKAFDCCENLLEFKLDDQHLFEIFRFYKEEKAFAKAEDILFILLENNRSMAKETALKFYNELLEYDDAELNKGNLPREEVLEGLKRAEL
jgi:Family of unknown function (DUF6483)